VTVSNAALEIVAALGVVLLAWRAHDSGRTRDLALAGAAFGAALLTKTTLVYLAPIFVWMLIRGPANRRALIAAVAIPAVMLLPWLAFNVDRYDALTGNAAARDQQAPFLNPGGTDFTLGDVPGRARDLLSPLLPQEWEDGYDLAGIAWTENVLVAALLVGLAIAAFRRPRGAMFLAAPLALSAAMLLAILVAADWDAVLPRYLYPALPAFALFSVAAFCRVTGEKRVAIGVAVGAIATSLVWLHLAGEHYFTDVGDRLPI
jgi:hypothetical protein